MISSSSIRNNETKELIKCKFGIHDLSRSRAMSEGDVTKVNMPYELGLDIGALEYVVSEI